MNIQVRVLSAAARGQLKALQAQMAAVNTQVAAGGAAQAGLAARLATSGAAFRKWGSQTQWAGRQLQRNFTIPLLLAGAAAVKFNLDNEKAFVHTQKVYGDTAAAVQYFRKHQEAIPAGMNAGQAAANTMRVELEALQGAFIAISERYGIAQKEVLEVAGAWAQAGVSGVNLAKSVDLTMQAMMLGQMDSAKATKALIAIQAQYNLSNKELSYTLAELNAVENQTGIELNGLIEGFRRAAGVAKSAGVSTRELAAQMAALVPSAGEAGAAGNALKTIYSRLLAPTGDVQDIIKALNIDMKANSWLNATAADRLKMLAKRFDGLSDSQRANAASVIGSRWQYNKLVILLDEMTSKTGFYQKALDATRNRQDIFRQATKELNTILDSSPKKFQQIWVAIQNGMANAIGPLIPYLLSMFNGIRMMVDWFQKLDPRWQKFIMYAALAVAVLPLLIIYLGSLAVFFGVVGTAIMNLFGIVGSIVALFLSPWVLAIAGVIAALIIFRKQVADIWDNIVDYFSDTSNGMVKAIISAWNMLPQGVANALIAVAKIVQQAAMAIYEWFSYINPWAHHSPSLVENVTTGIAEVNRQFGKLSVGNAVSAAYAEIKKFGKLTAQLGVSAQAADRAEDRKTLGGVSPQALASYNRLVKLLDILTPKLKELEGLVAAQQRVVDGWKQKLDAANEALDKQQDKLQKLSDVADKWKTKLDDAKAVLDEFASAPLVGMGAMEDAIFANTMATKALQLQMMDWEDVNGTLDDMKAKLDAINGATELLRGEQTDLRNAGAGSEILGAYQDQIDALADQKKAMQDSVQPILTMQTELEKLQRQAERLDLQKSLAFDPLTRQIEQAAYAMKELPFDEIMAGIRTAQGDIATYTEKWNDATAAVKAQEAVVKAMTQTRNQIQESLDKEQKKLDALKQAYDRINDAVQAINQSLQDVMSNADKLAEKGGKGKGVSPALQAFNDAKGGNFPDVGGSGAAIRTNWEDQQKQIDKFTEDMQAKVADAFGKLNPFGPIKEKWKEFTGWLGGKWGELKEGLGNFFVMLMGGNAGVEKAKAKVEDVWNAVKDFGNKVKSFGEGVWSLFGPEVMDTLSAFGNFFKDLWKEVGPELIDLGKSLKDLWDTISPVILPVVGLIVLALSGVAKVAWAMLNGALKPVLSGITTIIKGIVMVITGLVDTVTFLLTGQFGKAWDGLKNIIVGTWLVIKGLLDGVFGGIVGAVWGFVKGVFDWIVWLWDVLVGHSIIPDLIDAIWKYFKLLFNLANWIWDNVLKPIYDKFVSIWNNYIKPFLSTWFGVIKGIWNTLKTLATWVWDHVLKPIWDKFETAFKNVKEAVREAKTKIVDHFETMKTKAGEVVGVITGIPGKVKELGKDFFDAGKAIMNKLIDGIKGAAGVVADVASAVWDKLKQIINDYAIKPIKAALNFTIDPPGPLGPWDFNIGDKIPYLYRGGVVKGSRQGTLAVIGDRGYDEAVVPLEGPWAPRLGSPRTDWREGSIGGSGDGRVINIYGNLEFPNITDGSDASTFIENLEILAETA